MTTNPLNPILNDDISDDDMSDTFSQSSDVDPEDQRQLDIEHLYDLVNSNDKTRRFACISEAGSMLMSPDGITVFVYSDGSKSVKFTNFRHEAMPQWYKDEHNESVSKRVASLEQSLNTAKANLLKEQTHDPEKEANILKSIARLERKLQEPNLSEGKRAKFQKTIDNLTENSLQSARAMNDKAQTKYSKKIESLEKCLASARKTFV